VVLLACAPARADEIAEGLDRARQLYEQGDLSGAITETGFAMTALHRRRSGLYAGLFPPAPSGWVLQHSADDGTGGALAAQMLGGGVMVERDYTTREGGGAIKATVIVDSPMIQALAAMASNPALMGSGARRIRIGNDNAILQQENDSADMTLVRGSVAVKLEGSGLKDAAVLTQIMKGFDLAKLANPQGR
jgi:hypothetical protein